MHLDRLGSKAILLHMTQLHRNNITKERNGTGKIHQLLTPVKVVQQKKDHQQVPVLYYSRPSISVHA
jgi:hypothetical protein